MTLFVQDSQGYVPATDDQVVAAALRLTDAVMRRGPALDNLRAVKLYLAIRYSRLEHEVFAMILLDGRLRVIAVEELFRGTIDHAVVHPREVVKVVLQRNATAVILVHNHPSGLAEPSHADEHLTRRLKEALALIDVRVLDHLIVGHEFVESFAERGLL
jgi:DNA repair protein RadC